jgi:sulfoxide reductase catalytic subunit YedY
MDVPTAYAYASTYNNYYEFGTDKSDPAAHAHTHSTLTALYLLSLVSIYS